MRKSKLSKKALIRIVLYTEDLEPKDRVFKYHDFLQKEIFLTDIGLSQDQKFYQEESITENLYNEENYIDDIIKESGYDSHGIYEIVGDYYEEWVENSTYESLYPEWDCNWELKNYKIEKYEGYNLLKFIEGLYQDGYMEEAMNYVDIFNIKDKVIEKRNFNNEKISYTTLFKEEKNEKKLPFKI